MKNAFVKVDGIGQLKISKRVQILLRTMCGAWRKHFIEFRDRVDHTVYHQKEQDKDTDSNKHELLATTTVVGKTFESGCL